MGTRNTFIDYRFAKMGFLLWLFFVLPMVVVSTAPSDTPVLVTPAVVHAADAEVAISPLSPASLLERIISQFRGVWIFSAQVIQAVLQMDEEIILGSSLLNPPLPESLPSPTDSPLFFAGGLTGAIGSLVVNTPFMVTEPASLQGPVLLATTTVTGDLSVLGSLNLETLTVAGLAEAGALLIGGTAEVNEILASAASISGLTVSGGTRLNNVTITGIATLANLSVSTRANLAELLVTSTTTTEGLLVATGGMVTQGADINAGAGRVFASNIINEIIAGDSVRISGPRNAPIISFVPEEFEGVLSLNGETGEIEIENGTDISISGLRINNNSNLSTVRSRGGCTGCITDADVIDALTISGGVIENTVIGSSSPAYGRFSELIVGTTTASTTLSVLGATTFDTAFTMTGSGTSTFSGSIDITAGCFAINGTCIGGAPASTYTDLADTPTSLVAGAIQYASSTGLTLEQSAQFVFDGSRLAVGALTPLTTLTVGGDMSVLGGNAVRFYDNLSSNYVGFRASTTLGASQLWTLPEVDGAGNDILVTDGSGNLRFASAASLGAGVNTYLGLLDTPSSFVANAIPYASSSASSLEFSSNFIYDGNNLVLGTTTKTNLVVQGDVTFRAPGFTPGLYYSRSANFVGLGTANPTARLSVENGSFLQRGGTASSLYTPVNQASRNLTDSARDIDVSGGYAYVVTGNAVGTNFHVYDVTRPTNPTFVTAINIPAGLNGVVVEGRYAYVVSDVAGDDFHVIDISNPAAPVVVGSINLASTAFAVSVQGRFAYVVTDATGDDFHVIDISIPAAPTEVHSIPLDNRGNAVYVQGRYAYVVTDNGMNEFHVIDVSSSTNAVEVGSLPLGVSANGVFVRGGLAYVTTNGATNQFRILSIANPAAPITLGSLTLPTNATDVVVSGRYAYVTSQQIGADLHVIDVAVSATPVLVGQVDPAAGSASALKVVGRYAYVVTEALGDDLFVYDLTGADVQTAIVHSLEGGSLAVTGESTFAGRASFAIDLQVGAGGLQTDGVLSVLSSEDSSFVGRVGIGTSTPSAQLTVGGDIFVTGALRDSTNSAGAVGTILQSTGLGTMWVATSSLGFVDTMTTDFLSLTDVALGSFTANRIPFTNSGGTALIDSGDFVFDGTRLGIGTSTPNREVDVVGAVQANNFFGYNGSEGNPAFTFASAPDTGLFAPSDGQLGFSTIGVERVRLTSTGNIGIGTSTPSAQLTTTGTVRFASLGSAGANLITDADGNVTVSSDERLKDIQAMFTSGLTAVLSIEPITYKWNEQSGMETEHTYTGFSAQNILATIPEAVAEDSRGLLTLSDRPILATVVNAIKELYALVTGNQARITALEERIEVLEATVGRADFAPTETIEDIPEVVTPEEAVVSEPAESPTDSISEELANENSSSDEEAVSDGGSVDVDDSELSLLEATETPTELEPATGIFDPEVIE